MMECMLTALSSGSGKTAVACALLAALKKRGMTPCAFKCGPDYIDPMFHRAVLDVPSHNLDLFLSSEQKVRSLYERYSAGYTAAVVEGVMGFYDGVGGVTDQASAWHVSQVLNLPVVLVLRPKGTSLTLAAQVKGLLSFRSQNHVIGILLNDCSPMLAKSLSPMLEEQTGLPVLGFLPSMEQASFESRHLGLLTAAEIQDLSSRIDAMASQMEQTVNLTRLIELCERTAPSSKRSKVWDSQGPWIAVARDAAFCFTYEETLDVLQDAGARLTFFSPLRDACLPERAQGLYLPGGYPELYAEELSANETMRASVRMAAQKGMPIVAECGGFLYLGQDLENVDGISFAMAGVLPGHGVSGKKLVRFGYAQLKAEKDSLLFRTGEQFPFHEFHYWDSTHPGMDLAAQKTVTGREWSFGFATPTLYAGFPHLYFAGTPVLAHRFVQAACAFGAGGV